VLEDNMDQDFISLLEMFEIAEKKKHIGAMIALYFLLKPLRSLSEQSKKNMKLKIEKYLENLVE